MVNLSQFVLKVGLQEQLFAQLFLCSLASVQFLLSDRLIQLLQLPQQLILLVLLLITRITLKLIQVLSMDSVQV